MSSLDFTVPHEPSGPRRMHAGTPAGAAAPGKNFSECQMGCRVFTQRTVAGLDRDGRSEMHAGKRSEKGLEAGN